MNTPLEGHKKDGISRRGFLSLFGKAAVGAAISGSLVTALTGCEDQKEPKSLDDNFAPSNLPLKSKPIHLGYKKIVEDKDIDMINFPGNKRSMEARIARCLRWKPVTDAVEDRYHIPRGLLMAMMAQEGLGDPTMPNLPWGKHKYGDGGLGLIHIQAENAHNFGLKTLPRFTKEMCDDKHAELVVNAIKETGGDLPQLLEKDDRFHPVMAVDVAARFFMNGKKKVGKGTDSWIHALKLYSGRPYGGNRGYGHHIIQYWGAINTITGDEFPNNLSKGILSDIKKASRKGESIKNSLSELKFTIDGHPATYNEYLAYFEESMKNFELEKYAALGDSIVSADKQYVESLPEPVKENIKRPEKTKSNSLIKSEFVDTHQHNSEGFTLFRYRVKKGDNAQKISDAFDAWDKKHGNKYQNTGNRNIVNFRGDHIARLIPGEVVYVKAKK